MGSCQSVVLTTFCVAGHKRTRRTVSNRIWNKVHGDECQSLNPCRRSILYTSQRYQDKNGEEIGKLSFFWHLHVEGCEEDQFSDFDWFIPVILQIRKIVDELLAYGAIFFRNLVQFHGIQINPIDIRSTTSAIRALLSLFTWSCQYGIRPQCFREHLFLHCLVWWVM